MHVHNNTEILRLLHDRSLSAAVSNVSICPKMDLFAVVLDRISVAIFRINCQRLATISVCTEENEVITAFTWSPDGSNIVVASSTGKLTIYSVDRSASTPLRTRRGSRDAESVVSITLPVPATTLLWSVNPTSSESHNHSSEFSFLYQDNMSASDKGAPIEPNIPCLGLLLVGDRTGGITILKHNLHLTIARISALPKNCFVNRIHTTQKFSHAAVLGYIKNSEASHISAKEQCVIRVLNLDVLVDYWPEITLISRETVALEHGLQAYQKTLKIIKREWIQGAIGVLDNTIKKPIEKLMKDFAEDTDTPNIWSSLHDIYCGAGIKSALLQFLGTELSENGAKEALRSFRAQADDVEEAILSTLPIAEHLVFRTSEYRGLARIDERFAPVGVSFQDADVLFQAAQNLYLAFSDLAHEIETVSRETEAFLAWMVLAAGKAGGSSVQGRERLALGGVGSKDWQLVSDFFQRMTFPKTAADSNHQDTVTTLLNSTVKHAHAKFQEAVQRITEQPSNVISSKISVRGRFSAAISRENRGRNHSCSIHELQGSGSENACKLSFLLKDDGKALLLQYFVRKKLWSAKKISLRKELSIIQDLAFVDENQILFVTKGNCGVDRENTNTAISLILCSLEGDDTLDVVGRYFEDGSAISSEQISRSPVLKSSTDQYLQLGELKTPCGVGLSVDTNARYASILIKPHRVLLVKLFNDEDRVGVAKPRCSSVHDIVNDRSSESREQ